MDLLGAFAIKFKSGDWAGQLRQFMWFLVTYEFCIDLDRWTAWRIVILEKYSFLGKYLARTAYKFSSRISWSLRELIFSSTGANIFPIPSEQIHPHLILFSLFLNEVRSPPFVFFSPDPNSKKIVTTDHYLGFIGKNHTSVQILFPKKPTIYIFNNKFLFNNTPPVIYVYVNYTEWFFYSWDPVSPH